VRKFGAEQKASVNHFLIIHFLVRHNIVTWPVGERCTDATLALDHRPKMRLFS
jgi:hypothetical protein